jgi:hypothetical protein
MAKKAKSLKARKKAPVDEQQESVRGGKRKLRRKGKSRLKG